MRTGTSFPANSTCGGRPGLKIKSLTLSDVRSISRKTATKLGGGGGTAWLFTFGCSLLILIQELFAILARQDRVGEQTSLVQRTSNSSLDQDGSVKLRIASLNSKGKAL